MKLYAPTYYKRFQCIADRCEHSCCVGWEIDVDEETLAKYQALNSDYGAVIRDSISTEDTPHFRLGERERCPHLNERGLCEIILHEGEDYLCDICREHPRFYNFTRVAEVGLGMSCPEAARIILGASDYATVEEIGSVDVEADDVAFDGRAERERVYAILRDASCSYRERLEQMHRAYAIDAVEDGRFWELLASLEYLDARHKELFLTYSSKHRPTGADSYLERFLAYMIYRHTTEALDVNDFRARLAFCLLCERLLASLVYVEHADSLPKIATLASLLSEEIEYSDENTAALMR